MITTTERDRGLGACALDAVQIAQQFWGHSFAELFVLVHSFGRSHEGSFCAAGGVAFKELHNLAAMLCGQTTDCFDDA